MTFKEDFKKNYPSFGTYADLMSPQLMDLIRYNCRDKQKIRELIERLTNPDRDDATYGYLKAEELLEELEL